MNHERAELSMEMVFMILGLLVLAMIAFWLVQFIECKKDGKNCENHPSNSL